MSLDLPCISLDVFSHSSELLFSGLLSLNSEFLAIVCDIEVALLSRIHRLRLSLVGESVPIHHEFMIVNAAPAVVH